MYIHNRLWITISTSLWSDPVVICIRFKSQAIYQKKSKNKLKVCSKPKSKGKSCRNWNIWLLRYFSSFLPQNRFTSRPKPSVFTQNKTCNLLSAIHTFQNLDIFLIFKGGPVQWKKGFIKRPHPTANLNFPSPKLRVMLLFWFL